MKAKSKSRTESHAAARRPAAPQARRSAPDPLTVLNLHAAGIDLGSTELWVAVPPDQDDQPVRTFGTYTPDLYALADWLKTCHVTTVAMESTGIYWIPVYEILEDRGFEVLVVNAHHVKHVPGRKSDEKDCQWLQRLHTYGLLTGSFRPDSEICALRGLHRHRLSLIESRAAHIQRMQKALLQMNVQLTQTLGDITGVTGLAIVRRIVAGDRDPEQLAQERQPNCKCSRAEIAKALTGNYRAEHVFVLKQEVECYDQYTALMRECDAEMEQQWRALAPRHPEGELPPLDPKLKADSHSKNELAYDARTLQYQLVGVDLCAITGMNEITVQQALTGTGTDLKAWPNARRFCAWLRLAPCNDISGGKVLRSRTLKTSNPVTQAFRLAAQAATRSRNSAYGAYYRRMCARLGPNKAMTALAHKIARAYYEMLTRHVSFHQVTAAEYEDQRRDRELKRLQRKAAALGMRLVETEPVVESQAMPE